MNDWLSTLGGCTKQVFSESPEMLTGVILALHSCKAHKGAHHFAVVNEGRSVMLSDAAVRCLIAQGVNIDGPNE